jgi:hypothetical protein
MSKTYAIADLHGRLDLLEMALAKIADDAEPPTTLVTLGDYIDRGPDSRQVIELLIADSKRTFSYVRSGPEAEVAVIRSVELIVSVRTKTEAIVDAAFHYIHSLMDVEGILQA